LAVSFFNGNVLGRNSVRAKLPPRKQLSKIPQVNSSEEQLGLFAAAINAKHRALLETTYSGGLRVSTADLILALAGTDVTRCPRFGAAPAILDPS
jgi:site-specific recombinase XerD